MRAHRFLTAGLVVLAMLAFTARSAHAQTTAIGPYYATPSWDQKLDPAGRFIVLTNWSSQAVLDRETGLVWEQSPGSGTHNWFFAHAHCVQKVVGTRRGWRMPTIQELASLTDPTVPAGTPSLPPGHPFANVQLTRHWSATTGTQFANAAWGVDFGTNQVLSGLSKDITNLHPVWCVRGGQGNEVQ